MSAEMDALRQRAQQWIEDFEGAAVRPGETFLIIRDLLAALEAQQGGWQPAPDLGPREVEGTWPANYIGRVFVVGAKWWQFQAHGSTAWPEEVTLMEREAERRYPLTGLPR